MLELINKSTAPPGGYRYRVAETNTDFQAWTMRSLLEKVVAHLRGNGLPIPHDLEAKAEDFTCQGLGADFCNNTDPRWAWVNGLAMSAKALIDGTRAIASWATSGFQRVPQEKADARSETCAGCVFNKSMEGCAPCRLPAVQAFIASLVGGARSRRHDDLKACGICHCFNSVKVWTPIEHLAATSSGKPWPDWCWVKQEMESQNG